MTAGITAGFAPRPTGVPKWSDGGIAPNQIKPPFASCDGDGLVPHIGIPDGACTMSDKKSPFSGKQGVLATSVLLIGGALIGYGLRNQISTGLKAVKDCVSKFFANGKAKEILDKGKTLLANLKDKIFVKPQQLPKGNI